MSKYGMLGLLEGVGEGVAYTGQAMARNSLAEAEDQRRMKLEAIRRQWSKEDKVDDRAYAEDTYQNREIARLAEKGQDRVIAKEDKVEDRDYNNVLEETRHTRNRAETEADQKTSFDNQMKVAQFGVDNREPKDLRGEAGKLYDDLSKVYGPDKAKEMVQQSLQAKTKGGLTEDQRVRFDTKLAELEGQGITQETVGIANAYRKTLGYPLLKEKKVADGDKHWFKADDPPVTEYVEDAGSLTGGKVESTSPKNDKPVTDNKEFVSKLAEVYASVPPEKRAAFLNEAKQRYSPEVVSDAVNMVNEKESSQGLLESRYAAPSTDIGRVAGGAVKAGVGAVKAGIGGVKAVGRGAKSVYDTMTAPSDPIE